jgi:hypothetical protein
VLSLLGLAGSAGAGVAGWLAPLLIGLSILLLGRAFYVLYVQRRGSRFSKAITWTSALFIVGYWSWRWLFPAESEEAMNRIWIPLRDLLAVLASIAASLPW